MPVANSESGARTRRPIIRRCRESWTVHRTSQSGDNVMKETSPGDVFVARSPINRVSVPRFIVHAKRGTP